MSRAAALRPRFAVLSALLARDLRIARTYRLAVALELVFGLLNLAVFFFVSDLLDTGDVALPVPGDYFDFAAVGIAIALVVDAAVAGIAMRLREEQLTGTLEELITHPVRSSDFALGLGALPLALASVRVVAYLLAGWLFLGLDLANADWVGAVVVFLAIAGALLSIGAVVAAVTLLVKRSEVVVGLAAFAISMLGGAFFPISVLPEPLQSIAEVLPTTFIFDGARDALLVGSGWGEEALALAVFAVVALPISLWVFSRALGRARTTGTLSEY
jgi:ABC-type multidrug transport system permease subunit